MNNKLILGIDPGLTGGIGVITHTGEFVSVLEIPVIKGVKGKSKSQYNMALMADILRSLQRGEEKQILMVFVEQVHAFPAYGVSKKKAVKDGKVKDGKVKDGEDANKPRQGITSTFTFGTGYGMILGILAALQIPYTLVTPQRWQKNLFKDLPGKDPKQKGQLFVSQRFPELKIKKNLIDAFLIAYWGYKEIEKDHRDDLQEAKSCIK